jgi:hypothetical protein
MRFGNSSNYFGLQSNVPRWMAWNTATGKAFHAIAQRMSSALTNLPAARRIFSQQCTHHLFQGHRRPCGDGRPFDFAQSLP